MSAPARPTAGDFATAHLMDIWLFSCNVANLTYQTQAPTGTGADIFSKFSALFRGSLTSHIKCKGRALRGVVGFVPVVSLGDVFAALPLALNAHTSL